MVKPVGEFTHGPTLTISNHRQLSSRVLGRRSGVRSARATTSAAD